MKRSDINQPPCYFDRYIGLVDDVELDEAFNRSLIELKSLDLDTLKLIGDVAYAEGKWTVKDLFQHLIDAERVLAYRSLRIGRNDETPLPGFDESQFAANVSTSGRSLEDLVDELKLMRRTTACLFRSFDDEAMHRSMVINGNQMSALAYGFAIAGHQKHHLNIIESRYLPLSKR